jgi:2-dehydro-3-deoxyphosphogluconate aldolase/(4S)-4-hydroxy-2-oxoglutarate aldolase
MDPARFAKRPLLGILRGIAPSRLERVLESAIAGGLETLEITMNTYGAAELIRSASKLVGDRLTLGAGTVLNTDDLKAALDAGATFIVSPTLVRDVVSECTDRDIPVFPGALTPQEIHEAWRAGATMVKVFPAKFFGPEYFAEIKGPFADVKLLACGGVSAATLPDFARCGADAFAVGGSVFAADRIEAGQYDRIESDIRTLVSALP